MRLLLVEDQKKIASFIRKALQTEGFAVDVLNSGEGVVSAVSSGNFDVVILDIMLPGQDGLSILKTLRQNHVTTPVLLLSARGQPAERVEGLNSGADDYLSKPFVLAELIARVNALGRRGNGSRPMILRIGDLALDTVTHKAKRGEKVVELAAREYRLLEFLMSSPNRVCSRMAIVEKVWDYDFDPGTNLVDVYVMRLREKIDEGFETKLLHTVRGMGYVMRTGA